MFSHWHPKNLVITGGTFTNFSERSGEGFHDLQQAAAASAFHNSKDRFDPPKCHPNTRVAVLDRVMGWIRREESTNASIMWLYGAAGAGKSAIAQSIAELCESKQLLLASFFFSRSDSTRNKAEKLVPTIAYQICLNVPGARELLEKTIEHDPLIFKKSLQVQLALLVIEPLQVIQCETGFFNDPICPCVIIIDGLDECNDRDDQSSVLEVISSALEQSHSPLLFLISSRPEQHILWTINSHKFTKAHTRLALDDSYFPDDDIWRYLWDSFVSIKSNHRMKAYIPSSWPLHSDMLTLLRKASGQFIYAAIVVKYVNSPRHRPTDRLEIILGARPALHDMPFSELDMLYRHILSGVEDIQSTLSIVSFIILRQQVFWGMGKDGERVEQFLDLRPGDVELHLGDINSVIQYDKERARIVVTHASFQDFLLDSSRSQEFFIDPSLRHTSIARQAFDHLSAGSPFPTDGSLSRDALYKYRYSHCYLEYHCARAVPTPELRQDILDFSIYSLHRKLGPYTYCHMDLIANFISSIHSLDFEDSHQLQRHHWQSFKDFVLVEIEKYERDPNLIALIAVAEVTDWNHKNFFPLKRTLGYNNKREAIDTQSLKFIDVAKGDKRRHYFIMLRLINDLHLLDGQKYATAALYMLKFLCNNRMHRSHTRYSVCDRAQRKSAPFHWRQKTGRHGPLRHSLLHKWKRYSFLNMDPQRRFINTSTLWYRYRFSGSPGQRYFHARAYFLGLQLFPRLLTRSERLEELIEFSRRKSFAIKAIKYPRRMRIVRGAIHDYLDKYTDGSDT